MTLALDQSAARIRTQLPDRPIVVVVGRSEFRNSASVGLCEAIATELARRPDLVAVTGGMPAVGETFARAFARQRQADGRPEDVFHLLPPGVGPASDGVTLAAGSDFAERREVLGRIGSIVLVIEGGPGTEHEVRVARQRGATILPVARTGGHAGAIHPQLSAPPGTDPADWALLADSSASPEAIGLAVRRLVAAGRSGKPDARGRSGLWIRLRERVGPIVRKGLARYSRGQRWAACAPAVSTSGRRAELSPPGPLVLGCV